MTVIIQTRDGKIYTDPKKVHIARNKDTELFYRLVENYVPTQQDTEKKVASQ